MRAHILVVNKRDEILVDADVFDVEVSNTITWVTGGRKNSPESYEHSVPLSDLARIEITPVQDPSSVRVLAWVFWSKNKTGV